MASPGTIRRVLSPGQRHCLGVVDEAAMGVQFRGHDLTIRGDAAGEVLFPTDVGLSLLTALHHDTRVTLAGKRVLDVGCGCGLYTVAALAAGATRVTALDINRACVATTVDNVVANGLALDSVDSLVADVADAVVTQPWDVVLANPPHFPDDPTYAVPDGQHTALVGGPDGRSVYNILLSRLDGLLADGGVLVLAHSSLTGVARTRAELTARGYVCRTAMVIEMDMPMRGYARHRDRLLARLYDLRRAGSAEFRGLRFEVHVLIASRPTDNEE